ncbi:hypothetical protein GPJ56_004623 [Histomonas meleagridis]|uniref:uncharacterized protein n=1 Tax=Histomonas meleagridis TaxID=135588 RepID=UPI00355A7E2B|nr:hypothetical protein GPJ56_004623 [Histomonas meleagridis]KAH0797384.1 hypothetical protein GO595_009705 [Histomonas meleagridis]
MSKENMTSAQFMDRVRQQMAEVKRLKAEFDQLNIIYKEKSKTPEELIELRKEVDKLKKKQKKLDAQIAELPPKYRVPPVEIDCHQRHPNENQRLFPPKDEDAKKHGRVAYVGPKDFICHPPPDEIPQKCKGLPVVIARLTCDFQE